MKRLTSIMIIVGILGAAWVAAAGSPASTGNVAETSPAALARTDASDANLPPVRTAALLPIDGGTRDGLVTTNWTTIFAVVLCGVIVVFVPGLRLRNNMRRAAMQAEARENRIEVREAIYHRLFESAPIGIYQSTPDGRYLNANPHLASIYGYATPEELIREVDDIGAKLYVDRCRREEFMRLLNEQGEVIDFEARARRKNGTTIWVSRSAVAVRDASGALSHYEGFVHDITTQRQAARRLESMNKRLERIVAQRTSALAEKTRTLEEINDRLAEADRVKTEFLSTVSHELRTPMTSILGFAKLIRRDFLAGFKPLADSPRLRERAERIEANFQVVLDEGERLTRLINNLLDIIRIEEGRMDWNDQAVEIEAVVDRAVHAAAPTIAAKPDLEIDRRIEPGLPVIRIDPDRLLQVLINLMSNACKFTDAGAIVVGARTNGGGAIHLSVSDTGPGIPPAELGAIFDKFHQTSSEDRIRQGTGLGLAISRNIVAHYGGRIWAESRLGHGSTFHVDLPADIILGNDSDES